MRVSKSRLTICAVAAVLAGCGGSKQESAKSEGSPEPPVKVVQPGAPGEPSREIIATPTPPGGTFTAADVEFMQGMIHHHQQALTMTAWVPDRTANTSLRLMAKRMEVTQEGEVEVMRNWLKARGVDPNDHGHQHAMMPGMLSTKQLERLQNAKGTQFDKLFLRYMTQHHEGALQMVRDLQEKGGGMESEIGQFSLHVESDQAIEIERMQEMLREL